MGITYPASMQCRAAPGLPGTPGKRRRRLTDDEATIKMVDSNIYRNIILPSEKAFAYRMKLEAIKHQGKKSNFDTSCVKVNISW